MKTALSPQRRASRLAIHRFGIHPFTLGLYIPIVLLPVLLLAGGCFGPFGKSSNPPEAGRLVVTVTNATTNAPIMNASIEAVGQSTKPLSAPNGVAELDSLAVGKLSVVIKAAGYQSLALSGIEIRNGFTTSISAKLIPGSADSAIVITDTTGSEMTLSKYATSEVDVLTAGGDAERGGYTGGFSGGVLAPSSESSSSSFGFSSSRGTSNSLRLNGSAEYNRAKGRRFDQYRQDGTFNTEDYQKTDENEFLASRLNPLSTFSIDVDVASYSNIRRFLMESAVPPPDAVRIEEMVNYFKYSYPQPDGKTPFSVTTELAACPWNDGHEILEIGLQGKEIAKAKLPPSNLVFLIDVSGSMMPENKLPLLKRAFRLLVNELRPEDRVAIVVYAGNAGLILPSTPGNEKEKIMSSIENLEAGGSTAGGEGILLAYKIAKENFNANGNNRVILATDGDFNVGVTGESDLVRMMEEKRKEGIYLSLLGVGEENLKDSRMEQIADKGNGNYAYLDNILEAQKVLVTQMGGTLYTIAKDVKIQVEFNPTKVKGYRLIGYEDRMLAKEDFNNDQKDAGELGSGHSVTALYELIPASSSEEVPNASVDSLKYQRTDEQATPAISNDLLTVKLRYKDPKDTVSKLVEHVVPDRTPERISSASTNLRFASAVAAFGMLLRDSKFKGNATIQSVTDLAESARDNDTEGYRAEFMKLLKLYALLDKEKAAK